MKHFGRIYTSGPKDGQYYRCVTSLFLHLSFMHLFDNTIFITLWGSIVSKMLGNKFSKMVYIWIFCGISGDFFSSIFAEDNTVCIGASTAIAGLFGVIIGFVILNWRRLDDYRYPKSSVIIGVSIVIFMNLGWIFSGRYHNVDTLAHVGGFFGGIFLGMMTADIPGEITTHFENKVKILGFSGYFGFVGISFFIIHVLKL